MATIAIFAGHGGSDPGAVSDGLREKDFNLAVSNKVTSILRGWGYTVVNNRTTDVARDITKDANLANQKKVDLVVELHVNSNSGTPGKGTEAYVSIFDSGLARKVSTAILKNISDLGYTNRGIKTSVNASGKDAFGIIRQTLMSAVLLELAFINNKQDMERFNVDKMAMAVAMGIRDAVPLKKV